jgi:hypothetical protein
MKFGKIKMIIYVEPMYYNNIIVLPKTTIFIFIYVLHHVINILTYQFYFFHKPFTSNDHVVHYVLCEHEM